MFNEPDTVEARGYYSTNMEAYKAMVSLALESVRV
jgi:hypothetical protein